MNRLRPVRVLVVVLDIKEQGDHESLIAAGAGYARLFSRQAEGYATTGAVR